MFAGKKYPKEAATFHSEFERRNTIIFISSFGEISSFGKTLVRQPFQWENSYFKNRTYY